MRKLIPYLLSIIIILSFSLFPTKLTSETHEDKSKMADINESDQVNSFGFDIKAKDILWIDSLLNTMTIRERVAQMIMPWAGGSYTAETSSEFARLKYLVKDLKVGGLIFFKGDILNEALLINKMQESSQVPLLISSDFERGLAMRLSDATEFPYNMALAAAGDPKLAHEMARIIAVESRAMGVHQNYAPVADINNNADNPIINIRAYSENKDIVSLYCKAFIEGSVRGRMISTVKHFPGHGNTATDSHKELPVITGTRKELFENELSPFIDAIKSGVHSVMVGHLSVPSLDDKNIPATLSKNIITGLLKEELGFKGLIVTDAMNMNAITKYFSAAQAAVLAIKAGNDILLMPPDEEIAINSISDAVYKGEIPLERINESVRKILSAKKWIGLDSEKMADINSLPSLVGTTNNVYFANEIAEKSITLVKNDDNLIPINADKIYKTAVISISDDVYSGDLFNELTTLEFGYTRTISLTKSSTDKDYKEALDIARTSDLVFLPSFIKVKAYQGTVKMSNKQSKFINKILEMRKPTVIISFGNPYLLSLFPEARTYITSYGDAAVSQKAMMRALTGKSDITGKLPISIPGTSSALGDGIQIVNNLLVKDGFKYNFPDTDALIRQNHLNHIYPGASLIISSGGKVLFNNTYGKIDFDEHSVSITRDFIFDIDEITSLYTTVAALILCSEGTLDLNTEVSRYNHSVNDGIKVKDLLYKPEPETGSIDPLRAASNDENENKYNMLQKVIETAAGVSLDKVLQEKLFSPLKLKKTMYNPPKHYWYYSVPTSSKLSGNKRNKGVVYDQAAFDTNGITGHTGLFTTAEELSVFLQMLIQKGNYAKTEIIKAEILNSWLNNIDEDIFIYGKTGTVVWVNPSKQFSTVFLTNSSYTGRMEDFYNLLPGLFTSITNSMKYWQ